METLSKLLYKKATSVEASDLHTETSSTLDTEENGPDSDKQKEGIITMFPDELLLSIFQYFSTKDLISSIAKVSLRWKKLASEPVLWKNRFIYYSSWTPEHFIGMGQHICNPINYLHLGGHMAMEEKALQALLSLNVTHVRRLDFLGSCRTKPVDVLKILEKFANNIEALTLCVNDELVSYGKDGKTCYALLNSIKRPGLLFKLMARMENLKYLRLCGGFHTDWYFDELSKGPGCGKIRILDLKDLQELAPNFASNTPPIFIQALMIKNRDHLKSIKLSEACGRHFLVRECVRDCPQLKEISIKISQIDYFLLTLFHLNSLQLTGRVQNVREQGVCQLISFRHILKDLEELNFVQFSYIPRCHLLTLENSFHRLRVLRIDGNLIDDKNVAICANFSPLLEKLCVRDTRMVAKRHLVSLNMNAVSLQTKNIKYINGLDCNSSAEILQKIPVLDFKVLKTGCECEQNHLSIPEEPIPQCKQSKSPVKCCSNPLEENASRNYESKKVQTLNLILSNGLEEEFFTNVAGFYKLEENDIIFHFNQY